MDIFPFRPDPVMAVGRSLGNVRELLKAIQETDLDKVLKGMQEHNYVRALETIFRSIVGVPGGCGYG